MAHRRAAALDGTRSRADARLVRIGAAVCTTARIECQNPASVCGQRDPESRDAASVIIVLLLVIGDRTRTALIAAFAANHTAAAASEPVHAACTLIQRARNIIVLDSVCPPDFDFAGLLLCNTLLLVVIVVIIVVVRIAAASAVRATTAATIASAAFRANHSSRHLARLAPALAVAAAAALAGAAAAVCRLGMRGRVADAAAGLPASGVHAFVCDLIRLLHSVLVLIFVRPRSVPGDTIFTYVK